MRDILAQRLISDVLPILTVEVIPMEHEYEIAHISSDCIKEINELQEKLKQQTEEDIVLIAYAPAEK